MLYESFNYIIIITYFLRKIKFFLMAGEVGVEPTHNAFRERRATITLLPNIYKTEIKRDFYKIFLKYCFLLYLSLSYIYIISYFLIKIKYIFIKLAERVGFEPTHDFTRLEVFKTSLFNHLSTSPFKRQTIANFPSVRGALLTSPHLRDRAL